MLKDDADELKALQLANRINTKFFPNAVAVNNGKLESYYYVVLDQSMSEKKSSYNSKTLYKFFC